MTTGLPNTIGFTTFNSTTTYTSMGNIGYVGINALPNNSAMSSMGITFGQFKTVRANLGLTVLGQNGVNTQNMSLLNEGVGTTRYRAVNANIQIGITNTQITDRIVGFR